jgi:hypothetical protein
LEHCVERQVGGIQGVLIDLTVLENHYQIDSPDERMMHNLLPQIVIQNFCHRMSPWSGAYLVRKYGRVVKSTDLLEVVMMEEGEVEEMEEGMQAKGEVMVAWVEGLKEEEVGSQSYPKNSQVSSLPEAAAQSG